jgi:hypothetical protein
VLSALQCEQQAVQSMYLANHHSKPCPVSAWPYRCLWRRVLATSALSLASMSALALTSTQNYTASGLAAVYAFPEFSYPCCAPALVGVASRFDQYQSSAIQAFDTNLGVLTRVTATYSGTLYASSSAKRSDGLAGGALITQGVDGGVAINGQWIPQNISVSASNQGSVGTQTAVAGGLTLGVGTSVSIPFLGIDRQGVEPFVGTGTRSLSLQLGVTERVTGVPPQFGEGVLLADLSGSVTYEWQQHAAPSFAQHTEQDTLVLDFGDVMQGSATLHQMVQVFNNASALDGSAMQLTSAAVVNSSPGNGFGLNIAAGAIAGGGRAAYGLSFTPRSTLGRQMFQVNLGFLDLADGVGRRASSLTVLAQANVVAAAVPEASTTALAMAGVCVLLGARAWRRRDKAASS